MELDALGKPFPSIQTETKFTPRPRLVFGMFTASPNSSSFTCMASPPILPIPRRFACENLLLPRGCFRGGFCSLFVCSLCGAWRTNHRISRRRQLRLRLADPRNDLDPGIAQAVAGGGRRQAAKGTKCCGRRFGRGVDSPAARLDDQIADGDAGDWKPAERPYL